ncbi:MAG: sel1 repeat family protein [Lachnospiraceae bacterium]|nr:sel1 repeat family protein [Lachnospiraceae bacterium]
MKKWIQMGVVLLFALFLTEAALRSPHLSTDAHTYTEPRRVGEVPEPDYLSMTEKELMVLAYDGDANACYRLGVCYDYGIGGVQQNFSSAFDWYRTADAYGQVQAASGIGYLYLNGCGVDTNLELARQYFIRAVEHGDPQGYVGLGRVGLQSTPLDKAAKNEVFDNIQTAKEQGVLDGAYYLGYLYERGIGTKKRPKKAFSLYQRVADSDSERIEDRYSINAARTRLGILYMEGIGVEKDPTAAKEAFEIAAEQGYSMAEYYLGISYEMGYGTAVDYGEALLCFERAAQKNYAPALNEIGCMYFDGRGVEANYSQAVYYQKLAAALGYEKAQINLGFLYENGYGVERDLKTALMYYEMAEETGYPGASEAEVRVRSRMNGEED